MAAAGPDMDAVPALSGFRCADCGTRVSGSPDPRDCPDCGGILLASYDYDGIAPGEGAGLSPLLGVPEAARPALGAGETPLLDAPSLAAELGVDSVAVKDEGGNPTGGLVDRELALAVGAAREASVDTVALPSTGNAGGAAAAAAARAGLDCQAFVPSRTPFINKARINVHGGEMTVVEGRYREAEAAYREAIGDAEWYPLAPFATPYRQEGAKPIAYEIAASRGWSAPDSLVVPTGQVTALVGIYRGFRDLEALGLVEAVPRLVAAQASGCAPLAEAARAGREEPVGVEHPDTVVGPLEVPEPAGGGPALEAIRETGGAAVACDDPAILGGAQTLAEAGLPASATGGAALAAARDLADRDELGAEADIVLVNPVAGSKEADLMRSHLMSQGR